MNLTVDQIMAFGPCESWTRDRIEALFAGRESVTALEVADCEEVAIEDRLWLLLHEPIPTARQLRHLACDFAERALLREREGGRNPDSQSWAAIEVARRYADGKATDEELTVARDAARAAARDAAWDAAWAAEWVAARAAASAAAMAAARAAASAAAWDVERDWQLSRVREVLAVEAAKEESEQ